MEAVKTSYLEQLAPGAARRCPPAPGRGCPRCGRRRSSAPMRWRCRPRATRTGASPTSRRCTGPRSSACEAPGCCLPADDRAAGPCPRRAAGWCSSTATSRRRCPICMPKTASPSRRSPRRWRSPDPSLPEHLGRYADFRRRAFHRSQHRLAAGRRADRAGAQPRCRQAGAPAVRQHPRRGGRAIPACWWWRRRQRLHADRGFRLPARGSLSDQRGDRDRAWRPMLACATCGCSAKARQPFTSAPAACASNATAAIRAWRSRWARASRATT